MGAEARFRVARWNDRTCDGRGLSLRANRTKGKLKAGEAVFGCFLRYPSAGLVEMMGLHGWDFFVFDGEHGPIEPRDCEEMTRAAELTGVTPIARVPVNQPSTILRFLDTGAQGVHIPLVHTAAEAEHAVQSVKYQPRGSRGLAAARAAAYGQAGVPLPQYVLEANRETLVVLHVETEAAVEQLPEMLAVEDVDVIFIGQTDLSHSLGLPGQREHPRVQGVVERIVEAVASSDVALGVLVPGLEDALRWRNRGARYIAVQLESLVRTASLDYLASLQPR